MPTVCIAGSRREAFTAVPVAVRAERQLSTPTFLTDGLEGASLRAVAQRLLLVLDARDFTAAMTAPAPEGHNWVPNAHKKLPTERARGGPKPTFEVTTREVDLVMSHDPAVAELGRQLRAEGK
jgi:hypothetical protein